ncbi:MAG: T9SS type A sorting domain-containing protein, partial [Bacteroidota bacterium]|nr:T9SS type A sorting domain-containing protein [Bacteroidota bacterium]
ETAWQNAAHADILTSSGSEGFFNHYYSYGDPLKEPDYKEIYGRMLWSKDTLYLFYHVKEVKNDTLGLFFGKKFEADQVFVSLSNRLGIEKLEGSYNGAPYAAPNGPYHFFVIGDKVTLNGGDTTNVPEQYRRFPGDSLRVFNAADIVRWATMIDTNTATWDIEMAIYNPDINAQSSIGFNLGGSQGARKIQDPQSGDRTYSYYTWQPGTPNEPYSSSGDPIGANDPGQYNLVTSKYWPLLDFVTAAATGVEGSKLGNAVPTKFNLEQNYPNPFNPSTTIRFDVAKNTLVTLKVYNVVGQLVATLVNGKQLSPGTYAVTWNASNLASGMYLYSFEADGNIITKKMMLIK